MEVFSIDLGTAILQFGKIVFMLLDSLLLAFLLVVYVQFNSMNRIVKDLKDTPLLKVSIISMIIICVSLLLTALVIL